MVQMKTGFTVLLVVLWAWGCGDSGTDPEPDPTGVGSLRVTFRTPGPTLDDDGFAVTLDGLNTVTADANGEALFTEVPAGSHQIEISDVAANCALDGGLEYTVSVVAEDTATLRLAPWCVGAVASDIAIVFVAGAEGFNRGDALGMSSTDLVGIRSDGTGETPIVSGVHPDSTLTGWTFADPVWSPDGTSLLIVRDGSLSEEIWVAEADGSGVRHLATGRLPSWSPDGQRVAFVEGAPGDPGALRIINVDGTGLDEVDLGEGVRYVAWSPDGDKLAAEIDVGGRSVAVVDVDGSSLVLVGAEIDGARRDAAWSPDGERIVYRVVFGAAGPWSLWTAAADGSDEQELLTLDSDASARRATWSPDGQRILFSRYVVQCGPAGANACEPDLYTVATDGSGIEALVQSQGPAEAGTWRDTP